MFNCRGMTILRELMGAEGSLTSEYLAKVNQVTSRTVRNDIKELDGLLSEYGASIKSIRGTGYELNIQDDQLFRKLLQEFADKDLQTQGGIPSLPKERVQYLIRRLLLVEGYLKLEELADELFISKSTIQNDILDVKKILKEYGITLEKRPNYGLKLKGDELKLRFCMSQYIFSKRETQSDMMNACVTILPKEEIIEIRAIILEQIKQHEVALSDIALNNLVIHIAIACRRIRNENYVSIYPQELSEILKQREYEVAKNIVGKVEEALEVVFPQTEIAYIAIHLLGTRMVEHASIGEKEMQNLIDGDIYKLTTTILQSIENELKLGISHDKELIMGISLHLKPAINRYRYKMNLRNPMLDDIKTNYPVAFEAGILAGMVLKEELGIDIHENEIGYLALHIGGAIERKKMSNQKKRCMIVCVSGVGSAKLLQYRLQSKFGSKLEIVGTSEYYKLSQIPTHGIDFIISTIPISEVLSIPVIEVNTILGQEDLQKIQEIIIEDTERSFEYTKEELVFLNKKFETKEEVLYFLGEQLKSLGYIKTGFIDSVLEREAISPTAFGNLVAIPHPIAPQTDSTFWAICTLQKPIQWEDKRVQFVCLLSVRKNSTEDLQNMYKLLANVIEDSNMIQQLLKCKTYKEFLSIFLK